MEARLQEPKVALCVFCRTRPASSAEHIVLNALGGQKVARNFSCEQCNNQLGASIDGPLESAFRFISLVAGAHNGRKRAVAPLEMLRSDSGERVWVEHGGTVRPRHQATVTILDGATAPSAERLLKTFDPESVAQLIAAEVVRRGLPGLPPGLTLTMHDQGPVPFKLSGSFGGAEQFRAVAKMGLAALHHRAGGMDSTRIRKLCRWIAKAEGTWPYTLDAVALAEVRRAVDFAAGEHVLAVWPVGGRLEATFLGFGFIPYRVRLPPRKGVEPFAHVVDPVGRGHRVVAVEAPPDLLPIERAASSQEPNNVALRELFAWLDRASLSARANNALGQTFQRLREQGYDFLEPEHIEQLVAEVVSKVAPSREPRPLDTTGISARVAQIIRERTGG